MTTGGWLFMLASVGGTTALLGWCIARVLRSPQSSQKFHAQPDIDTQDIESEG